MKTSWWLWGILVVPGNTVAAVVTAPYVVYKLMYSSPYWLRLAAEAGDEILLFGSPILGALIGILIGLFVFAIAAVVVIVRKRDLRDWVWCVLAVLPSLLLAPAISALVTLYWFSGRY